MKKTMKNCLRKLCCNFCFMLLGAFSKAEISAGVISNEMKTSIESIKISTYNNVNATINNSNIYNKDAKKISNHKKGLPAFTKKRKKMVKQTAFEIKELPQGDYTVQSDNDPTILVTKRIMTIK
jgi:exoribonuclease II